MVKRVLAALAAAAACAFPLVTAASASPNAAPLIDQAGKTFTLQSLHGRPLVVTFVSAHCTDACPLVNAQFASAATRIACAGLSTLLLTLTLDPEHDTPHDMRAMAQRFEANPHYWLLASGTPQHVDSIVREFGVVAEPGKSGYREAHSTFVYIFDASGNLRNTLMASTNLDDDIVEAARAFAKSGSH